MLNYAAYETLSEAAPSGKPVPRKGVPKGSRKVSPYGDTGLPP